MQLPRLKEWRESRGLLQKELATEAGLSEFTITRIEGGDSIRPNTARRVADALGLSVGDLMERPPVPLADAPKAGQPRLGEEQREDLGGAYRGRYSVPRSKPAETIEGVFGGGYPPPTVEEVMDEVYGRWEKHVARFVDRWMKKLDDGDFDRGGVEECWATLKDYALDLGELNRREQEALPPQQEDAYGRPDARTGRAIERISDLLEELYKVGRPLYREDELARKRQERAEVNAFLEQGTRKTG